MSHRWIVMSLLIAALALAGCGATGNTASAPSPESTAMTQAAAPQPTAASEPTRESTATAEPTVAGSPEVVATDLPAPTEAAAPDSPYADLTQSQTPEGYYALGDPDAPVVMNHYSDFL
jgi:glucose/arabinose dehydrogenase